MGCCLSSAEPEDEIERLLPDSESRSQSLILLKYEDFVQVAARRLVDISVFGTVDPQNMSIRAEEYRYLK